MHPGARPHIDQPVGGADRLLVMLDDDHGVAKVAQPLQRIEQPAVVALVQPDGGFVEHIEHAGEARADLGRQADALALAAGERARIARQGEILEADIDQEAEPLVDLLQNAPGDLQLFGAQPLRQAGEPVTRPGDRHLRRRAGVQLRDPDRQRLGLESVAVARRAGRDGLVFAQLLAHPTRIGLAPAPGQVRDHALERPRRLVFAQAVVVAHRDRDASRAEQDDLPVLLAQLREGCGQPEAVMGGEALEGLAVIFRAGVRPRRQRALVQAQRRIRHHQFGVEFRLDAEAVAGRAGAERVVEGEQPGLDLVDGEARDRAGEPRGKGRALTIVGVLDEQEAVGQVERRFDGVGQPARQVAAQHDAVHDDIDIVLELLVQRRRLVDQIDLAVHLDALEAALLQVEKFLAVFALAPAHDGREQVEPAALRHRHDRVDHLGHGLALDRQAGRGRIGDADPRPQQAHVVVDFGDRADRRARVARGRLLFDGDRRRQALDMVDVRLFHQLEELAGIGRQALDIAALALGIDRIEGERGFARAAQPGDDRQRVARDLDVDVLQIVLARAAHPDMGQPGGIRRGLGNGGRKGPGHRVSRKIGHIFGGKFNSAVGPSACRQYGAEGPGKRLGFRRWTLCAGCFCDDHLSVAKSLGIAPGASLDTALARLLGMRDFGNWSQSAHLPPSP